MFNNFSYRIAGVTSVPKYLYEELRKDGGPKSEEYMEQYRNYLNRDFNLDENTQNYALRYVNQLVRKPELIKYLEEIFWKIKNFQLEIDFVKYLVNNFDDAFYKHVNYNIESIFPPDLEKRFNEALEAEKKNLLNEYMSNFRVRGGIKASTINVIFEGLVREIKKIISQLGGNLDFAINLIDFFNKSEPYILPLVYHNRKSRAAYRHPREANLNSLQFSKIISDYISKDIENRIDIINYFDSIYILEKYIESKNPELLNILSSYGFHEEDTNFSLQTIRNELYKEFIGGEKYWEDKKSKSTKVPSKYFNDFNLDNSSNKEKQIFADFEKLGLHAIPAEQKSSMSMLDENGEKFGFRIDFLLPCNVREYDGENYSLRQDIIFIGEYFGYFGADYDAKKVKKMQWQNSFEKSLDQRCLHIDLNTDLCSVLKEKNIDSKCYPDFNGHLFDVKDNDQRKSFYVKSQLQNFIYTYLVNELLWQIGYNYNLNTIDNFNKVKEKNKSYIDRYNDLIAKSSKLKPSELVSECAKILEDYKNVFAREKKLGEKSLRLSKTFNNRKNSSIL